jgi:mannosyl-3-phosphoglycerate phosphatase
MSTWEHAASAEHLRAAMADDARIARADTRQRSAAALRDLGFRTTGAVRRALEARTHSVLLDPQVWSDDERAALQALATARGFHLRRGGRWFTLTAAGGKGPALCALRHQYTADGVPPVVAAIGNEENDQSLLAEADCRFVIRNPHRGPHPVLSSLPGAVLLDAVGPGGWMEMLNRLVPCARQVLAARHPGEAR